MDIDKRKKNNNEVFILFMRMRNYLNLLEKVKNWRGYFIEMLELCLYYPSSSDMFELKQSWSYRRPDAFYMANSIAIDQSQHRPKNREKQDRDC